MKRIIIIAAAVSIAFTACNKAEEPKTNPDNQNSGQEQNEPSERTVTIKAIAPSSEGQAANAPSTKIAIAESGSTASLTWATGDAITVFDTDGGLHEFDLDGSGGSATGSFTIASPLSAGKELSNYALYPHSASNAIAGTSATIVLPVSVEYGNNCIPLAATSPDAETFTFRHIAGAFKFTYDNVPAAARAFVFTTNGQKITGSFTLSNIASSVLPASDDAGASTFTVTFDSPSSTMEFYVPVPAGTYHGFSICLTDGSDVIEGSQISTDNDIAVTAGHIKPMNETEYAINLSASGTANCYIVPSEGRYYFNGLVMGNGDAGIVDKASGTYFQDYQGNALASAAMSPSSASLLWEKEFGTSAATSGGLISDVELKNGRIYFTASTKKGNAVIAAKDSEGTIMWSWHIWLTNTPSELTYMSNKAGNAWIALDKNLGANKNIVSGTGQWHAAQGCVYQWGRKDPIPGTMLFNTSSEDTYYVGGETFALTKVELATAISTTGTIAYAIQHPATFIMHNIGDNGSDFNATRGWTYPATGTPNNTRNSYLWGNPNGQTSNPTNYQKSIYDPCPVGYKVPGKDFFSIFVNADLDANGAYTTATNENLNIINNDATRRGWYLYYSAWGSGELDWYGKNSWREKDGTLTGNGNVYSYYWTSSTKGYAVGYALRFLIHQNPPTIVVNDAIPQARACPVRCVKE